MNHEPWAGVSETHTAAVFFAGDRAYKVKKPVKFGFVDFSSMAKRRQACEREVELNRRLAPDVYVGVGNLVGPDGATEEPVVVMRRMPGARRLASLITDCSPDVPEAMVDLGRLIADFHDRCAIDTGPNSPGSQQALRSLWDEELRGLSHHGAGILDDGAVARMRAYAEHYLDGREVLFLERVAAGRVRDGHGDLQADDIFLMPDGPRVLDCLDFDDQLRIGDVLLDVAFLAMDLERLGVPSLARAFLDAYRQFSAETHPASLEHFYIAYRANIRAKVSCIRVAQGDVAAGTEAKQLAQLSQAHLEAATIRMVLVGGLPGSGKTTLAADLAAKNGWIHLNSDVVRKELAGVPTAGPAGSDYGTGLYTPEMTRRTYATALERASTALRHGQSVVLDASWRDSTARDQARTVARQDGALATELVCVVPDQLANERLRARGGGASDANASIRRDMSNDFARWPEAVSVSCDGQRDASLDAASRAISATTP